MQPVTVERHGIKVQITGSRAEGGYQISRGDKTKYPEVISAMEAAQRQIEKEREHEQQQQQWKRLFMLRIAAIARLEMLDQAEG